jgi:hypothetical protein
MPLSIRDSSRRYDNRSILRFRKQLKTFQMIIVASPSKPFLYTPKGSLRRSATLDSYEAEIEAIYEAVAEATQEEISAPAHWSPESSSVFVRRVVTSVVKAEVSDQDDLFERGCDRWISSS